MFCTQIYFFGNVLPFCIWQNNFVMNASIFPFVSKSFHQKRTIATFLNHFDHNTIASTVLPSQVVSFRWTGCPEPRGEHLHIINGTCARGHGRSTGTLHAAPPRSILSQMAVHQPRQDASCSSLRRHPHPHGQCGRMVRPTLKVAEVRGSCPCEMPLLE